MKDRVSNTIMKSQNINLILHVIQLLVTIDDTSAQALLRPWQEHRKNWAQEAYGIGKMW